MESESRKEKEMERESGELMDHQAELFTLHEEIMSLARDRKDLLASLTPNLFVWEDESATAQMPASSSQEEVHSTWKVTGKASTSSLTEPVPSIVQDMENLGREVESASTRIAGSASSVQRMDSSLTEPAAVSGSPPNWQQGELENYLDSILQDMDDLGHRMLSVADDNFRELDTPISLYKKAEMLATASRLVQISEDLSNSTIVDVVAQAEEMLMKTTDSYEDDVREAFAGRGEAQAEEALNVEENMALANEFLRLCNNYLEGPNTYRKHLALIITPEEQMEMEKEKERQREMEREREKEKEREREREKEKEKERERARERWMEKKKAEAEGKGKVYEEEKKKGKGKGKKNKEEKVEEEEDDGVFWEETSKEYLKWRMVIEQGMFNKWRVGWEDSWGSKIGLCGRFHHTSK